SKDTTIQIQTAWKLTYSRNPTDYEINQALEHLHKQQSYFDQKKLESNKKHNNNPEYLALASLCHVLLNTNEFAYID
ncbi:MAG: hypothetical protein VYC62_05210, partial [Verrucomicrobiota bacterium]|nr:hypothetical protein [Verrucomicrobiota bacterium]